MRYRKLDADGDYSFGHSSGDFLDNSVEAVAQSILTRLRLFTGEWFLDITKGTPYSEQILGNNTWQVYDQAIKTRILGTQFVTRITDYASSFDPVTRALTVSAKVDTAFGSSPITITV